MVSGIIPSGRSLLLLILATMNIFGFVACAPQLAGAAEHAFEITTTSVKSRRTIFHLYLRYGRRNGKILGQVRIPLFHGKSITSKRKAGSTFRYIILT